MRRTASLTASALVSLALAVGVAPAALADDGEGDGAITMPDLTGDSLAAAQSTMADIGLPLDSINITGYPQKQRAANLWKVCSQLPKAGTELSADSYAAVGVVRKGEDCGG
ncbi:PASTA domain-containing protein [Mycolicibacterium brumae]|uniref:PASTA domain-containing protein n=1 Tax=Mycolicibacterium brumae TaxID=85968 RepID=A0A2G5PBU5_9MYCO|nr:PASTA domain-containing protein [Mycolicibacterium brumae]MCV7193257.1 PASTA domain-containing protein [Mycolicibacterium brumae]PIB75540.1 PASTA domain-containing protein [Mycolicibacterium brumae]RWA16693.1 hypothetical protein MBRU_08180 [Mycolicibacterium brumae DSM 44177]UWW09912.1 PASTA domain-containing protein [Mycolicibacterium brumae]